MQLKKMVFPDIFVREVTIYHKFFKRVKVHIYKTEGGSGRFHVIKHRDNTQTIIGDESVRFELVG